MLKIYTKTGDKGNTMLYDGKSISKYDTKVEAYGTTDELQSYIGLSRHYIEDENIKKILFDIQRNIFFVSAELATEDKSKLKVKIEESDVSNLEKIIDEYIVKIERSNAFIVPGTSLSSANLHVARTICRRAERRIVELSSKEDVSEYLLKYINRLSDVLYTFARYLETDIILMDFKKYE